MRNDDFGGGTTGNPVNRGGISASRPAVLLGAGDFPRLLVSPRRGRRRAPRFSADGADDSLCPCEERSPGTDLVGDLSPGSLNYETVSKRLVDVLDLTTPVGAISAALSPQGASSYRYTGMAIEPSSLR